MNRRKFVIGLGAASASGSALIGSGAFTSVSAERDIAVSTAGDDDAFLRLGACTNDAGEAMPNGGYVDQGSDGLFSISLSGNNGNDPPAGSGVNQNAVSRFDNVFEFCNQGTQEVCVDFAADVPVIPNGADVPDRYSFGDGDLAVIFYRGANPEDPINVDELNPDRSGAFELDVGECQCVGIEVRAFGFGADTNLFDEGAELDIIADAEADCGGSPPVETPSGELERVYANSVDSDGTEIGVQYDSDDLPDDRDDPEVATGPPSDSGAEFVSLGFEPEGANWDWEGGGRLTVEFDEDLVKRPYATDVLDIETTNGRDDYPEEKALVEVAGPGTDDEFVELGMATNEASNGENTFELPAEPITRVRVTDKTDRSLNWPFDGGDGFDVKAVGGYTEPSGGT